MALILRPEGDEESVDPAGMAEMMGSNADSISEIIAMLLESGADPNAPDERDRTPLHLAARRTSDPDIVTALVGAEADPNATDENGQTPLHVAVRFTTNPIIVVALIDAGGNLKAKGNNGSLPRDFAEGNPKLKDTPVYRRLMDGQ